MAKQEITNALNLPPELAIRFFQKKVNVPTEKWDDLWNEQHTKGFMVAGAMKADLLQDFRDAVNAGIENGESLDQFRAKFDQIVAKHGWDYHGTRNWRSQVIFDTNVRTAYAAGRWQQMTDPEVLATRPYLQYRHGDSVKPRPLHLAWDKKVLPANSPWWETHYPPGGYGCKCKVYSLSKRDLARLGKTGPDNPPDEGEYEVQDRRTGEMVKVPRGIDPGFNYNPGRADLLRHEDILGRKLAAYPKDVAARLYNDLKSSVVSTDNDKLFAEWVDGVISNTTEKGAIKTTGEMKTVWFVEPEIQSEFQKESGKTLYSSLITVTDRKLIHSLHLEDLKTGTGRNPARIVTIEDAKYLPAMIREAKAVLYDTKDSAILYIFDMENRSGKWAVKVNCNAKKAGFISNLVTSGAILPISDIKGQIAGGIYKILSGDI